MFAVRWPVGSSGDTSEVVFDANLALASFLILEKHESVREPDFPDSIHCGILASDLAVRVLALLLGCKHASTLPLETQESPLPPALLPGSVWSLAVASELLMSIGCTEQFLKAWDEYVADVCSRRGLVMPTMSQVEAAMNLSSTLAREMTCGMRHVIPFIPLDRLEALKRSPMSKNKDGVSVIELMSKALEHGNCHIAATVRMPASFLQFTKPAGKWTRDHVGMIQELFGRRNELHWLRILECTSTQTTTAPSSFLSLFAGVIQNAPKTKWHQCILHPSASSPVPDDEADGYQDWDTESHKEDEEGEEDQEEEEEEVTDAPQGPEEWEHLLHPVTCDLAAAISGIRVIDLSQISSKRAVAHAFNGLRNAFGCHDVVRERSVIRMAYRSHKHRLLAELLFAAHVSLADYAIVANGRIVMWIDSNLQLSIEPMDLFGVSLAQVLKFLASSLKHMRAKYRDDPEMDALSPVVTIRPFVENGRACAFSLSSSQLRQACEGVLTPSESWPYPVFVEDFDLGKYLDALPLPTPHPSQSSLMLPPCCVSTGEFLGPGDLDASEWLAYMSLGESMMHPDMLSHSRSAKFWSVANKAARCVWSVPRAHNVARFDELCVGVGMLGLQSELKGRVYSETAKKKTSRFPHTVALLSCVVMAEDPRFRISRESCVFYEKLTEAMPVLKTPSKLVLASPPSRHLLRRAALHLGLSRETDS